MSISHISSGWYLITVSFDHHPTRQGSCSHKQSLLCRNDGSDGHQFSLWRCSFSIFSLQWQWALTLKHVFAPLLFFLCHRNTGVLWTTPVITIQNNVSKYRQDMYAHIVFIYACINNIHTLSHTYIRGSTPLLWDTDLAKCGSETQAILLLPKDGKTFPLK